MTSNINVSNIDANFPIAGQDNSSEGFHNNYSAIKTALNTAATEISDLQNYAVLKDSNSDLGLGELSNAVMKNSLLKVTSPSSINPTSYSLDFLASGYQKFSISTATSFATPTFSNWPASGIYGKMLIEVTASTSTSVTFTANGSIKTETGVTFPYSVDTGVTLWELWTTDAGATVFVKKLGGPFA